MISNEDDLLLPGFAKVLCNTRFRAVWVSVKAILTNGPWDQIIPRNLRSLSIDESKIQARFQRAMKILNPETHEHCSQSGKLAAAIKSSYQGEYSDQVKDTKDEKSSSPGTYAVIFL